MLVELKETGINPEEWSFKMTDGQDYVVSFVMGIKPLEAQPQVDGKAVTKTLIKLKEAGFTADEIIEMSKANLLYTDEA